MPAPASLTFSADAHVAAHQALLDLINTGASDAELVILDAADTELAAVTLDLTTSAVNGTTGQLTFAWTGSPVASASGIAAYGEIRDKDGSAKISLPTVGGSSAVSGKLVINTLTIIAGQPVSLVALTVG